MTFIHHSGAAQSAEPGTHPRAKTFDTILGAPVVGSGFAFGA
jgi:hypothetical protein